MVRLCVPLQYVYCRHSGCLANQGVLRSALAATPHGGGNRHGGSASVFLSRTSMPHFADEEAAARQNFVMKCTVAMSTRGPKLLPWQQVDHVCSMTDLVFECKTDLTDRFKRNNRDGGTMFDVCSAAYTWFEEKYGTYCPFQCEKLQCRPTCAWLKEKKRLDKIGKVLADEKRNASTLARGSAELSFKLQKAALEAQNQIAKNKTGTAGLQKVEAALKAKKVALEQALAAESKSLKDLTAWDEKLHELRKQQDKAKEALDEARRIDDKAGMKEQLQEKAKERINKKIADKGAELEKTKAAVDPIQKKLGPLEEEYKFLWAPTIKQAKDDVEKAQKAVDERTKERKAAEEKLKAAGNSPVLEDLVKQKRSMEQEARDYLSKKKKAESFMGMSAKAAKDDINNMKKEIEEVNAKAAAINKTMAQLKEEVKQEEKKADGSRAKTAESLKNATLAYELAAKKAGEQEHVRTYWVDVLNDKKEASSKARKAVTDAEKAIKLEHFGFDKQIRDAAKAVRAEKELQKVAKDAQAEAGQATKSLEQQLEAYKKDMKDLESRKPGLVKLHGLGLISKLGY